MEHFLDDQEYAEFRHEIEGIPWLGFDHDSTRQYEIVPMDSYPILRGWKKEHLEMFESEPGPIESLEELAMFQSWLFFGLWESFLARPLASREFVFETPKGLVIRTMKLKEVMDCARFYISKYGPTEAEEAALLLSNALGIAESWNHRLVGFGSPLPEIQEVLDAVIRLTAFCAESMKFLFWEFRRITDLTMHHYNFLTSQDKGTIYKRLRAKGWCQSLIGYLIEDLGPCSAEYAALIGQDEIPGLDHQGCSTNECLARKLDPNDYSASHIHGFCHCDFEKPDLNSITFIYQHGGFPLIDLYESEDGQMSSASCVKPFQNDSETPFVAISHVWSDGLGGDAETGLPRCRLSDFRQLIASCRKDGSVSGFHLAYIDSLCIPKDTQTRKKAINTMARIYNTASVVLVLDSNLRLVDVSKSSPAKVMIRILTSPWNHRLWTLQEALLAQELVFVFHDGLYKAWDLWRSSNRNPTPVDYESVLKLSELLVKKFGTTWLISRLLRRRSTSAPEDEFLAIAPLLNLEAGALTNKEGLDRCCEFWRLLKEVPRSIIFLIQTKIPMDGFRWAPISLIGSPGQSAITSDVPAIITAENGLRGTYDLLVLQHPQHIDFIEHPVYRLITASRQQVFFLKALDEDSCRISCDAIIIRDLKPVNKLVGLGITDAVCLWRRNGSSPELDVPQYEYKLNCQIDDGFNDKDTLEWDTALGPERWMSPLSSLDDGSIGILCDVRENQTIYIT